MGQNSKQALLVFFVLSTLARLCQGYVSHGQLCDQSSSSTSCDPNKNIACRGGRCECINTDDMEYDEDSAKCVVLTRGSCYKGSNSNYPCVSGAFCHYQTKECVCSYQQSPTSARHCVQSHGSRCNATVECNPEDLLVCLRDRCRCPNPLLHLFREGRINKCFVKVGGACKPNAGPEEVSCDTEESACSADADSETGYSCQCIKGFHLDHFVRRCVRDNLQPCKDEDDDILYTPCDETAGLRCYEGICQCSLAPDVSWDPLQNECAVLEGRGCNLQDKDRVPFLDENFFFRCMTGLDCVPFDGHAFEGICRRNSTLLAY